MKVKTGFSKEEKVKACEKYHSGKYSYGSIAKKYIRSILRPKQKSEDRGNCKECN